MKRYKQDQIPKAWKEDGRKLRQKDTDARWTKKRGKSYFGYKNHIMIDSTHKIIRDYTTTSANVHDSQACIKLIETMRKGELIFGDSAYPIPTVLLEGKKKGILTLFCEKGKGISHFPKIQKFLINIYRKFVREWNISLLTLNPLEEKEFDVEDWREQSCRSF
ncbi:transposase, IS4-like family protein [Leptospira noguchii str. 2007001578]|uniref:Transposase, IS4-like family protein n=1 Tax=Leptospira noguchii str. 2007001578 TaxID=1049974 RepID=A0ABP2T6R5_9LEPT|nr:transposase, IS4-like family protein [Leptospira noguchii str. 2007001578]